MNADLGLETWIKENELSGILAWAVKGFQRLSEQGHYTGTHTAEYNREQWHNYQDTTGTFVRNYVTQGNPVVDEGANKMMSVHEMHELHNYITADFRYPDAETTPVGVPDGEGGTETVRVWDGVYVPKDARDEISEQYKESL